MMTRPVLGVLCLTLFGAASTACDDNDDSRSSAASRSDAGYVEDLDFTRFDDAVEQAIAAWNESPDGHATAIHGASALVVTKERGLIYSKGYGEFAADRLYYIASSSKILSVGVLMRLQDRGMLEMDTPVSEYLADWGEHKTTVTLAQMVSNSSGLPSLSELVTAGMGDSAALTEYSAHFCQYMPAGTLADCAKGIYTDDLPSHNREPDREFRYGGSQWQLAGAVAEVVSGKSWADLIQETYVKPCGTKSLAFTNPFGMPDVAAFQYPPSFAGDADNAPASDNPSIEGGAYITGPDYAKILMMQMRGGKCGDEQVLSANAVKRMQTDRVAAYGGDPSGGDPSNPFHGYGLGWWISDDYIADPGAYGAFPAISADGSWGAMLLFEASSTAGAQVAASALPVVGEILREQSED